MGGSKNQTAMQKENPWQQSDGEDPNRPRNISEAPLPTAGLFSQLLFFTASPRRAPFFKCRLVLTDKRPRGGSHGALALRIMRSAVASGSQEFSPPAGHHYHSGDRGSNDVAERHTEGAFFVPFALAFAEPPRNAIDHMPFVRSPFVRRSPEMMRSSPHSCTRQAVANSFWASR